MHIEIFDFPIPENQFREYFWQEVEPTSVFSFICFPYFILLYRKFRLLVIGCHLPGAWYCQRAGNVCKLFRLTACHQLLLALFHLLCNSNKRFTTVSCFLSCFLFPIVHIRPILYSSLPVASFRLGLWLFSSYFIHTYTFCILIFI